ncbi:Polyadenylate-binding protein 2, partial [Globisporangium splendens]
MAEASNVDLEQLEAEAAQMEEPATASSAAASTDADSVAAVDAEIEDMKRRVKEMEEEAAKLSEMQSQVETQMGKNTANSLSEIHAGGAGGPAAAAAAAAQQVMDDNSIYIGQVDYGSTPEELQALFQSCGTINRVTILCDKFTGQPKGYAYIEFASRDAVESAILLNDTMFRGRQLKVTPKRQNVRGYNFSRGGRGGGRGGRGGRGRGRGRGPMRGGFRGGRGGGRGFHPYF